jgi:hypothetical protein
MAHFAQLNETNNVIQIDVVNNEVINNLPFPESEPIGVAFLKNLYGEATNWVQTSYNNNFRGIYAVIGGFYDPELDVFVVVKPFPSWVRDENGTRWKAPVEIPDTQKSYIWDESIVNWVEVVPNQVTPT